MNNRLQNQVVSYQGIWLACTVVNLYVLIINYINLSVYLIIFYNINVPHGCSNIMVSNNSSFNHLDIVNTFPHSTTASLLISNPYKYNIRSAPLQLLIFKEQSLVEK